MKIDSLIKVVICERELFYPFFFLFLPFKKKVSGSFVLLMTEGTFCQSFMPVPFLAGSLAKLSWSCKSSLLCSLAKTVSSLVLLDICSMFFDSSFKQLSVSHSYIKYCNFPSYFVKNISYTFDKWSSSVGWIFFHTLVFIIIIILMEGLMVISDFLT